jgi:hypothetical protein
MAPIMRAYCSESPTCIIGVFKTEDTSLFGGGGRLGGWDEPVSWDLLRRMGSVGIASGRRASRISRLSAWHGSLQCFFEGDLAR